MDRSEQEVIGIHGNIHLHSGRHCQLGFLQQGFNVTNCFRSVGSRHLVNDTGNGVVTIYTVDKVVSQTPQLDIGDIFQTQDLTIRQSLYNYLLKLISLLQTSFIADRILERLISLFAERTRSGLYVLFRQGNGYVART